MVDSLCASKPGLKSVDRARRIKRWNKTAEVWCSAALTSRSTLSRFWAGHPIRSETFIAICDAVGVNWQDVMLPDSNIDANTNISSNISSNMSTVASPSEHFDVMPMLETAAPSFSHPTGEESVGVYPNLFNQTASSESGVSPQVHSRRYSSIYPGQIPDLNLVTRQADPLDVNEYSDLLVTASASTSRDMAVPQMNRLSEAEGDRHDWVMAPAADRVYGRTDDLQHLQTWIVTERCRWVGLFGMGGIGKTTLAAQFARTYADRFDRVIWRSLCNAPMLDDLLRDLLISLIQLSMQPLPLPPDLEGRMRLLLKLLQEHRCLIVFDNVESVLQSGDRAGCYRAGYDNYGRLFRCIGETLHQSCVLITSRERLKDQFCLEGENLPVRCFQVAGLAAASGQAIVADKGTFIGSATEWDSLVNYYSGNPLALQIVASAIRDSFEGKVGEFLDFLRHNPCLFDDICTLVDQQFDRLSHSEQQVMYWLAISRGPISLTQLQDDMVYPVATWELMRAIATLQRRSLIETAISDSESRPHVTQQPVIMQCVTWRLVRHMAQELLQSSPPDSTEFAGGCALFRRYALLKAQAKDYIREAQSHLIVVPLMQMLVTTLGSQSGVEHRLLQWLSAWRGLPHDQIGYGGSNVLNLLRTMQVDLSGQDFSHLPLWQADLRGLPLNHVNLTGCDLTNTALTQTFGSVVTMAFSPDGTLLASGDGNGEVQVWSMTDRQQCLTFQGHSQWIQEVAFSPDGSMLATASDDHTICLWRMPTGELIHTLRGHHQSVRTIAFTPDGRWLISGSSDESLRLWEPQTGHLATILNAHHAHEDCTPDQDAHRPYHGTIWSLCISADGRYLVSSGADRRLRLWDLHRRQLIHTFEGHQGWVWSVDISPDGRWIASASDDGTVALWDRQTGLPVHWFCGHFQAVRTVRFNWHQPADPADSTSSCADASQTLQLISGGDDGTLRFWDVATRQPLNTWVGHDSAIWAIAISPDGQMLTSSGTDRSICLWDLQRGDRLHRFQGYAKWVLSVAISPNGQILASGGDDHIIRLWNPQTGQIVKSLIGHRNWIWSVAFSPDGRYLASASDDHTVRLWHLETGRSQTLLTGHQGWVLTVSFSPDGSQIASGGADQTIRLWDVNTGQLLKTLTGHSDWVRSVAFHPNGLTLYSGSEDGTIWGWNLSDGCQGMVLKHQDGSVRAIAISPDGSQIASTHDDHTVCLWHTAIQHPPQVLQGHTAAVLSAAFSPDGRILVTGSADQTIRLWQVETGTLLHVLHGHTQSVQSVTFSPEGQSLISGSKDGSVRLWNLSPKHCQRIFRAHQPYEGMNIAGVTGLTEAQRSILHALGAIAR